MQLKKATSVAAGAASARIGPLSKGSYLLTASTDCWINQGASANAASAGGANCVFMGKGSQLVMDVVDGTADAYLAAIQLSAAGHVSALSIEH